MNPNQPKACGSAKKRIAVPVAATARARLCASDARSASLASPLSYASRGSAPDRRRPRTVATNAPTMTIQRTTPSAMSIPVRVIRVGVTSRLSLS